MQNWRPGGTSDYIPGGPRSLDVYDAYRRNNPPVAPSPPVYRQQRQGFLGRLMDNPRRQMLSQRRQARRERRKSGNGLFSKLRDPFKQYPGLAQNLLGGYKEVAQPTQRDYYSSPSVLMPRYY